MNTPEELKSAYLDMDMAGRQIEEAKTCWEQNLLEWTFLALCDAEAAIQTAKAKVGSALKSNKKFAP